MPHAHPSYGGSDDSYGLILGTGVKELHPKTMLVMLEHVEWLELVGMVVQVDGGLTKAKKTIQGPHWCKSKPSLKKYPQIYRVKLFSLIYYLSVVCWAASWLKMCNALKPFTPINN